MSTIGSLLQEPRIIGLVVVLLVIVLTNQFLWHRRQMAIIQQLDFRQPDTECPSQLPQILGLGLVVSSIGVGGLIETFLVTNAGGTIIFTLVGVTLVIYSLFIILR